jgi:hypothetical protein
MNTPRLPIFQLKNVKCANERHLVEFHGIIWSSKNGVLSSSGRAESVAMSVGCMRLESGQTDYSLWHLNAMVECQRFRVQTWRWRQQGPSLHGVTTPQTVILFVLCLVRRGECRDITIKQTTTAVCNILSDSSCLIILPYSIRRYINTVVDTPP